MFFTFHLMLRAAVLDADFVPRLNAGEQVYAMALKTNVTILIDGGFTSVGTVRVRAG